jgi:hypothetical protein
MRKAVAVALAVAAGAVAMYFGGMHLAVHGSYPECLRTIAPGEMTTRPCAPASRAVWQLPVAVLIAGFGAAGAVSFLRQG